MKKPKVSLLMIFTALLLGLTQMKAEAAPIVLTFEGLQDTEAVENFYDGGLGGNGSGPGPDFDITFSLNALAIIDEDAGGSGNFGGEPSPNDILFFLTGSAATMNVPSGFDTGFSFFYSAINDPGVIRVYDGLGATGNVLTFGASSEKRRQINVLQSLGALHQKSTR